MINRLTAQSVTILALVSIAVATVAMRQADVGPTVAVTGGTVRGARIEKGGAVFKGIPYAQPPVGDLRWREPMPVKPWNGVRDATAFGAICPQTPIFIANAEEISNEDCLFLNIWTPEWPVAGRKPVMVWIPGGGNFAGGHTGEREDGGGLARHGVVVVGLNYRLGTLGFFSHPALTRESPHRASGNQGILDQIAALKWVQNNIVRFGGDPANVTLFGNSAGSLDVNVLMASPLAKGLFRRVIGQSGPVILVGDPLTLTQAERRGESLVSGWKLPARATLRDLRAVPAADILAADPNYLTSPFPNLGITVDGYVFPKQPAVVFSGGDQHPVALMIGSNARERIPGTTPPTDLKAVIDQTYGAIAPRAHALYAGPADSRWGTSADQWATDTSFRCSTVAELVWHAAAGHTAFQYEFARVPPGREALGATHASELAYVFGTLNRPGAFGRGSAQPNEADVRVSDAIQKYWTNFAKSGDPNGSQLPNWPRFEAGSRAYMEFGDAGPIAKAGLRRPYCDLFIENVNRLMTR